MLLAYVNDSEEKLEVEGNVVLLREQTDELCCNRRGGKAAAGGGPWPVEDTRGVVPSPSSVTVEIRLQC